MRIACNKDWSVPKHVSEIHISVIQAIWTQSIDHISLNQEIILSNQMKGLNYIFLLDNSQSVSWVSCKGTYGSATIRYPSKRKALSVQL